MVLKEAARILKEYIGKDEKIAIALSGGKDSMCLISLVLNSGIIDKKNICAVNVNHGIRGAASDRDSLFVKEFCFSAGIIFIEEVLDIPRLSKISGKSIETQAREERRSIFRKLIDDKIVSKVLLAHHMNDQAETILMHIFRGSGLGGLIGMRIYNDGILRPLLTTSRTEIDEYISQNNIPYITDETNAKNDYNRNYLRNEIMPLIKARWNNVENALSHLSLAADENERLLLSSVDDSLIYVDEISNGVVKLDIKCFLEDKPFAHYVFKALKTLGVYSDIEYKHIMSIKSLACARNGAKIDLTSGLRAVREYETITLYYKKEQNSLSSYRKEKDSVGENEAQSGVSDFEIEHNIASIGFGWGIYQMAKIFISITPTEAAITKGKLIFDYDKVPKGSIIRKRRAGDIFKPVHRGTKKLKEFLIDKKIPSRIRDDIPCLCYGNEVLLLLGLEVSEKIKIDKNTVNAALAEIICEKPSCTENLILATNEIQ